MEYHLYVYIDFPYHPGAWPFSATHGLFLIVPRRWDFFQRQCPGSRALLVQRHGRVCGHLAAGVEPRGVTTGA